MSDRGPSRSRRPRRSRIADRLGLPSSALPSREDERHASWLELFFDLVFALALASVQSRLTGASPGAGEAAVAFGLFAVVWWAWVGQAFYDTRFDPDDLAHRFAVLLGMAGAGMMAIGAEAAPRTLLLPLGYLVVRAALLTLYLRVRNTGPMARQVTTVYLTGFGTGWILWLGSLAAPVDVRPLFWVAGMVVEFLTPWVGRPWLRRLPVHPGHLPERLGQFTIILLGASLMDLLDAVPPRPPVAVLGAAALAFVVPAVVWWVYTTFVSTGLAIRRLGAGLGYAYLHGLLGAALLLLGWGLGQLVRQVDAGAHQLPEPLRLLVAAAVVTWMVCGLALQWISLGFLVLERVAIGVGGAAAVVAVSTVAVEPTLLLGLLATVMVGYAVLIIRHIARLNERQTGP
ncbi:low temperature requirement protein A [Plantactinospora sp. CA-290183]|uniref:low temperature requirement protein A n=1 Tax=Plantactinospora sp. CA-290183 TaxID=3240006 RepID=UPI003D93FDFD